MQPFHKRLKVYALITASTLALYTGLLVTGYSYTKSSGFYTSLNRQPMSLIEALAYMYEAKAAFILALVCVVLLSELILGIARRLEKTRT